jgi:hypothetical protein
LERAAVVLGTTAKAIGKGEKNTNKSSVLSRDNEFRVIDRPNHARRAKAVEIVSVQIESVPFFCPGIVINHCRGFDVIDVSGSRVLKNHTLGKVFKCNHFIAMLNSNFHFIHSI